MQLSLKYRANSGPQKQMQKPAAKSNTVWHKKVQERNKMKICARLNKQRSFLNSSFGQGNIAAPGKGG